MSDFKKPKIIKNMKKIAGIALLLMMVTILSGCNLKDKLSKQPKKVLGQQEAKDKLESFIKGSLLAPGAEANVVDIIDENGMYKVRIALKMNGQEQEVESYLSRDGKIFFPSVESAMDIEMMEEVIKQSKEAEATMASQEQKEVPKTDKPEVKLFVMSYCPFGTQIEKGIIPVLETLGAKVKFELAFVDYTMHGDSEADENMRQYCIQKNNPAKILGYLKCFLKSKEGGVAEAEKCMVSLGINKATTDSCIKTNNEKFGIKAGETAFPVNAEDDAKYGVEGSPTLVINGTTVSAGRDSASLLKAICGAFKNEPAACQKKLSETAPSAGFGEGTGSSTTATCE